MSEHRDLNREAQKLIDQHVPHVFIQWKNTDACFDFRCECGWEGHYDGYFAYSITCGGCEKVWDMPNHLLLTPTENHGHVPVRPDPDGWDG